MDKGIDIGPSLGIGADTGIGIGICLYNKQFPKLDSVANWTPEFSRPLGLPNLTSTKLTYLNIT